MKYWKRYYSEPVIIGTQGIEGGEIVTRAVVYGRRNFWEWMTGKPRQWRMVTVREARR